MNRILFLLSFFLIVEGTVELRAEPKNTVYIADDLYLEEIAPNVWIHVSIKEIPQWGKVPANGLVVLTDRQIILIDTPWTDLQTQVLVKWLEHNIHVKVKKVIVCHYHDDNLGGLTWIHNAGIESYSIERTQKICREKGLPIPRNTLEETSMMVVSQIPIQVFFPGEGHTVDSICVYLPNKKILFGGCSVKALDSKTLGNTAEANLEEWPISLRKMKREFPEARIVVPGHGKAGTLELIDHTLALLRQDG